jgi:8-oxo-dGTP pyrophosphatase MutT (NUDIX family)
MNCSYRRVDYGPSSGGRPRGSHRSRLSELTGPQPAKPTSSEAGAGSSGACRSPRAWHDWPVPQRPDPPADSASLEDDPVAVVRAEVAAFEPATDREVASRERFLAELGRLADPFSRDADQVHVTGSAIVSGPRGTVLHWHKRLGGWLQPGGHVDPGEAPWQAALRETVEETGLPVRHPAAGPLLIHLDAHPAGPHFHLDLRYLLLSDDVEPSPPPGESQQVSWFTLAEAIDLADAALFDGLIMLRSWAFPSV